MVSQQGTTALLDYTWKIIPPTANWLQATLVHRILGIGGQALLPLFIIGQGGLSASSGPLTHVGAGGLLVLALLLFWFGRLQHGVIVQRCCAYSAGALLSLVVSWELLAFRQTNLDLVTLAPASYLSVISPFLMREPVLVATGLTLARHRLRGAWALWQ